MVVKNLSVVIKGQYGVWTGEVNKFNKPHGLGIFASGSDKIKTTCLHGEFDGFSKL